MTPPVEVAVGVVLRADGSVLLGQRVAGKPYAGWWEFPGGKLERGETVAQALARELHEELGIEVRRSTPWVVREFVYPHARVRLHFRRVDAFGGEPVSREGQAFAWLKPDSIDVAPLLPATVPVIGWLRLPPRLAWSAAAALGEARFLASLERRLREGRVAALVFDEPQLRATERFDALLHEVARLCREYRALLLTGPSHPDSPGFDGRLLAPEALATASARPAGRLVGAMVSDGGGLADAARIGLDFAVLVAPEGAAPADPATLLATTALPAYLGGRYAERGLAAAIDAGAHGVVEPPAFWQDSAQEETK